MKTLSFVNKSSLAIVALALFSGGALVSAQSSSTAPDNTKVNKEPGQLTADQQKDTTADRDLTAKIRQSIVDDKTLSTYAHNVKIISRNGQVTLKGPVRSQAEADAIAAKATDIAGAGKVVNQLSVKAKSKTTS